MHSIPPKQLFSYKPYWAKKFGIAPFLPTTRAEMDELEWDSCDVILISGDAYIDHPSFGASLIGRLLEANGFRVGIIAQPNWKDIKEFQKLGKANLYFGITAGNMDSMVNKYTADKKLRNNDAYTPEGLADKRPERSVVVYSQNVRSAFPNANIVIGGIEASLRRIAHYDYWSDKVRKSILIDSGADLLLYGNAERAIVELTHQLAAKKNIKEIQSLRGSAFVKNFEKITTDNFDNVKSDFKYLRINSFEEVSTNKLKYAQASRVLHLESNPGNAQGLIQQHQNLDVVINPPPIPLSTNEIDAVYDLPYSRAPHPLYGDKKIPAWEMIRFSVNIMRGCFGGCTFCSITEHEGRVIQSRSEKSVLREIENIKATKGFTGAISDLGGPTANMWRLNCSDENIQKTCRRLSCVFPSICVQLKTDHQPLINLYQSARKVQGVKSIAIASGVRYDLAIRSPDYIRELAHHHVGGYLKIAPEHTEEKVLKLMMKPNISSYSRFAQLFFRYSREAGKEQYLIPYFIAGHPGSKHIDMAKTALWLKENNFRPDQVQTFLPTPLALATTMYYTEINPLKPLTNIHENVSVVKLENERKIQKAFLRYHDKNNWALIIEVLNKLKRKDIIVKLGIK